MRGAALRGVGRTPHLTAARPAPLEGDPPPVDAATLAWLLDELGTDTDVADLETRYDRLGTARAVALSVLRQRKADLIAQPSVVGVSSVVNINTTANIAALERQIAALEAADAPRAPDEPESPCEDASLGFIRLHERRRR